MMNPMTTLLRLRTEAGKTLGDVADEVGMSASTVRRHENGVTPLSGLHRLAYATYYGVKADSIEQPGGEEQAA